MGLGMPPPGPDVVAATTGRTAKDSKEARIAEREKVNIVRGAPEGAGSAAISVSVRCTYAKYFLQFY
jgi:hypothetical protein